MTVYTWDGTVGSGEQKRRAGMIEADDIGPDLGRVASFAADRAAVGAGLLHPFGELAIVRVVVTRHTSDVSEVIGHGRSGGRRLPGLVAIEAGHGHVPARKREAGFVMPPQSEGGRRVGLDRVAILAAAIVRRPGELAFVDVRVTVQTLGVFEAIIRALPGGNVTLGAGNRGVFSLQRVACGGVLGHSELCSLEAFDRVASLAGAAVLAGTKLSTMRIRSMAISAFSVRQWGVKGLPVVTGAATHGGVLSEQRVPGAGVVEDGTHPCRRHLLPHGDAVAGIAVGFEAPAMRIGVAGRAFVKGQADVLGSLLFATQQLVALLTGHADVRSGKREFRFGMVES